MTDAATESQQETTEAEEQALVEDIVERIRSTTVTFITGASYGATMLLKVMQQEGISVAEVFEDKSGMLLLTLVQEIHIRAHNEAKAQVMHVLDARLETGGADGADSLPA